jgi:hypothetical protein
MLRRADVQKMVGIRRQQRQRKWSNTYSSMKSAESRSRYDQFTIARVHHRPTLR